MQGRNSVVIAWGVGLLFAALAYTVGPQYLLFRLIDSLHLAIWQIGEFIGELSLMGLELIRAIAIGLYATFVVLALSVIRRGGPAKAALLWVSVLFLFLIGGLEMSTESNARWLLAMAVSGVGAVTMTQRLRHTHLVVR